MEQIDFSSQELKELDEKVRRNEWIPPEKYKEIKRFWLRLADKPQREDEKRREIAEAKEVYKAICTDDKAWAVYLMCVQGFKQTTIAEVMGVSKQRVNFLYLKAKKRDEETPEPDIHGAGNMVSGIPEDEWAVSLKHHAEGIADITLVVPMFVVDKKWGSKWPDSEIDRKQKAEYRLLHPKTRG